MILNRVKVDCDLSECALKEAIKSTWDSLDKLYVSTALVEIGRQLANLHTLSLFVDTNLPQDAWYITGRFTGVYSPGA